jgi:hypothetical protein
LQSMHVPSSDAGPGYTGSRRGGCKQGFDRHRSDPILLDCVAKCITSTVLNLAHIVLSLASVNGTMQLALATHDSVMVVYGSFRSVRSGLHPCNTSLGTPTIETRCHVRRICKQLKQGYVRIRSPSSARPKPLRGAGPARLTTPVPKPGPPDHTRSLQH